MTLGGCIVVYLELVAICLASWHWWPVRYLSASEIAVFLAAMLAVTVGWFVILWRGVRG